MKLYIGSDHGGFELKQQISESLRASHPEMRVEDLGPYEFNPEDDFPVYAFRVAERVAEEADAVGVLICRSGNGMAIAANKVKGIRAALCFSKLHAQKAREDDHANVCVLDNDYEGDDPLEIVETFLAAQFADGRHDRRVQMITDYEQK